MFDRTSQSNVVRAALKPLVVFSLLILGELNLLFGTNIDRVLALINEPPAQEVVEAGLFDFEVDYLGEVVSRKKIDGTISCAPQGNRVFNLGDYDYFIIKMDHAAGTPSHPHLPLPEQGGTSGFNFVNFGPYSDDSNTYWKTHTVSYTCGDNTDDPGKSQSFNTVEVLGNNPSNYRIRVRPNSTWGKAGHQEGWRVWRVKVNGEGYPNIKSNAFVKHGKGYAPTTENYGTVTAGCKVNYLMLDDDPPEQGDARKQTWYVQRKQGANWVNVQTINVPDAGMVVGQSFHVDEFMGNPELRLILEVQDSIAMLHLETCVADEFSWQVKMKGVFIANGQREREGVGESGFKFERDLFVPPGVAPLLIEYDPKYLVEFAGLLGEALIDWIEIPN